MSKRIGVQRARRVAVFLAASSLLGACAGGGSADQGPDERRASEVRITTFVYEPNTLEVSRGTKVRWINDDEILHTATSGKQRVQGVPGVSADKPARPDGLFDLQLDGAGSSASFTFDEPGIYRYFCTVHAAMTGRVVVA